MITFDLHIHTSRYSPDSSIDPFALVRRAVEIGLNGIVITEHDAIWPEDELDELRAAAPGLVVLSGVEVSAREGHILVYGVADRSGMEPGTGWADVCRRVREQGGVALAAHPNRFGQDFDRELARSGAELAGVEVMSKNMDAGLREKARRILDANPAYASLGNSDAHATHEVGRCVTDFDVEVRTAADLVTAIRERRTSPRPGIDDEVTR